MNKNKVSKYGLFLLFFLPLFLYGSEFHWEVITNMNDAREILVHRDTLYAATSGGFVVYPLSSQNPETWTVENGLVDQNFTCITAARNDRIVLGTLNGTLTFYNPKEKSFREDFTLKENWITDIFSVEDTLWITTGKSVAVYLFDRQQNQYQFRDFFANFDHPVQELRSIVYFDHRIWAASNNGIITAPGNFLRYNLKAAENWNTLTTAQGMLSDNVFSLAVKGDTLLIGTNQGLSKYDRQTFRHITAGIYPKTIDHIRPVNGTIYVHNTRGVYRVTNGQFTRVQYIYPNLMNDFYPVTEEDIWLAVTEKGLWNESKNLKLRFNGPIDNSLGEALLDSRGRLWVVSGGFKDERGRGFSVRLTDGTWKNFRHLAPWRATASAQCIMEDTGGNIWIGSWNGGLTIIDPNLKFYHFNNYTTTGKVWVSSVTEDDTVEYSPPDSVRHFLSYTRGEPTLVVITDIMLDIKRQSIWLTALSVQSEKPIIRFDQPELNSLAFDSLHWHKMAFPEAINITDDQVAALTMDIFDNIWIGTENSGVVAMQIKESGEINWLWLTESDNLKSSKCWAVAGDQDGYVWIGTHEGLNAYFNGELYDFREDYQPIGLRINKIFVDRENNKWFATDKGLSLLRANGSPWSASSWVHFVPKNSEFFGTNIYRTNLPSEEVRSVFVDDNTGDVYCSTTSGLAILRSNPFTTPLPNLDKVTIGPNPFIVSRSKPNYLRFRNLTANSQVKILTSAGRLVRTLTGNNIDEIMGSYAQWDGRNQNGKLVSSGVYLYLIVDENGNSTAGKFVVIRE